MLLSQISCGGIDFADHRVDAVAGRIIGNGHAIDGERSRAIRGQTGRAMPDAADDPPSGGRIGTPVPRHAAC